MGQGVTRAGCPSLQRPRRGWGGGGGPRAEADTRQPLPRAHAQPVQLWQQLRQRDQHSGCGAHRQQRPGHRVHVSCARSWGRGGARLTQACPAAVGSWQGRLGWGAQDRGLTLGLPRLWVGLVRRRLLLGCGDAVVEGPGLATWLVGVRAGAGPPRSRCQGHGCPRPSLGGCVQGGDEKARGRRWPGRAGWARGLPGSRAAFDGRGAC